MAVSVTQFLDSATTLGLLTGEEAAALGGAILPEQSSGDANELARRLVRDGKLTKFQAAAIYQQKADDLVLGNYVVLDLLGAGGMGRVFRARHRRMDRVVALKVLPRKKMSSPEAIERFQREVKAAAKLTHPNIVTAYDADEAGGTHFLVMEYVEGSDLSVLVKKTGPLRIPQVVSCLVQAARGLQHAHAAGVIHRDVKPSNLLLDKMGKIKILDMGLARIAESSPDSANSAGSDMTQAGQLMGTVDFIAPEQALDTHQADARADIYSLGCTLYFLLTGRAPYAGETSMKRLVAHRECPIPSLRAARPEVPEELEQIYQGMVAKHVTQRYQSMNEVIAALEPLGRSPAPADFSPAAAHRRVPLLLGIGGTAVSVVALAAALTFHRQPVVDQGSARLAVTSTSEASAPQMLRAKVDNPAPTTDNLVERAPPMAAAAAAPRPVESSPPEPKPAEPVGSRKPLPAVPPAVSSLSQDLPPVEPPQRSSPSGAIAMQPTDATADAPAKAPPDDRQPVPDTVAQQAALATIKQLFEADYVAAKDVDGKTSLAQKLLAEAEKTTDDPTGCFVLLCEARDLAAELADITTFDKAIDMLAARYRIDMLSMQAVVYQRLPAKSRPAAANKLLAEKALALADRAIAERQLDSAEQLLKAASLLAGKARDGATVKEAKSKKDDLSALRHRIEAVDKARNVLAKNPDDPEANLALGIYLCLDQEDWEAGLSHLAKSSDTALKQLAAKSSPAPATAALLTELGDAWWDAAAARKGKDVALVRSGARHWYAAALPALTGVNKAKVEKRLAESEAVAGTAPKVARPTAKPNLPAVDLLKMIDLTRDTVAGTWTFEGASLLIPEARAVRLQLPFIPPVAYSMTVDVVRTNKAGTFVLGLVLNGRQFCLAIDSPLSGISTVDGKYVKDNETATNNVRLETGKAATIRCTVTDSHVVADVDGKQFLDWQGDAQRLSIDSGYAVPNSNALFIGGNGGSFTVSKIEIGPPAAK